MLAASIFETTDQVMTEINTESFQFNGQTFEIKTFRLDNGFKVVAFKDGQRVNPYNYSVTDEKNFHYAIYSGEKGVEKLVNVAKSDIENGLIYGQKL